MILTSVISGLCVAIPSIIATVAANRKDNALVKYRIDQLDAKVNKHNNLIERMYKVEERISILEEKLGGK
ncbi:MAG: hypothetical protein IIZ67_06250 [Bacilli bacterium]|nr:hypothetical protein [Bacilli bacterium]